MFCDYKKIVEDLNNGIINKIQFSIEGYSHYNNCTISRHVEKGFSNKNIIRIEVQLTKDSLEKISFYESFKEDYKLFKFGRKGSFTLKQLWKRVRIIEIEQNHPKENI